MEEEIIEDLITRSYNDFSIVPCHWQLILGTRLLERRNLVGTAATGDGKTFTFFLPLLREPKKVVFIIAPLKGLADQHAASAKELGFAAISLTRNTMTKQAMKVC